MHVEPKTKFGRIVNFSTIAVPMHLDGEALYAASKSGVETFSKIIARELADFRITCNVVGPTPIRTDLIKAVPSEKIENILVEVKRSHDTLQRQSQKTEKYRTVKNQIFDVEVKIRLLRLKALLESKHEIEKSLGELTEQRKENQTEIDGINESMEQNIDLVNNMESKLIESQKTLYGIDIEK